MASVNLKSLIGKLNETCHKSLEAAAGLCLSRTNYNVEIEHWLLKLVEAPNSDITALLRFYEIDASRLLRDLMRGVDRLQVGNSRAPALSSHTVDLVREGWLLASIDFGAQQIRSGHLLCALLNDESLARMALTISDEFQRISSESLRRDFHEIVANSVEEVGEATAAASMHSIEISDTRAQPVEAKSANWAWELQSEFQRLESRIGALEQHCSEIRTCLMSLEVMAHAGK